MDNIVAKGPLKFKATGNATQKKTTVQLPPKQLPYSTQQKIQKSKLEEKVISKKQEKESTKTAA